MTTLRRKEKKPDITCAKLQLTLRGTPGVVDSLHGVKKMFENRSFQEQPLTVEQFLTELQSLCRNMDGLSVMTQVLQCEHHGDGTDSYTLMYGFTPQCKPERGA